MIPTGRQGDAEREPTGAAGDTGGAAGVPSGEQRVLDEQAASDERRATGRVGSRLLQLVLGLVLGLLSSVLLAVFHRVEWDVLGVAWPVGLLVCLAFQIAAVIYLWTAALRRTPILVFLVTFLIVFGILSSTGPLGSTLVPAQVAGVVQWQSGAVILIGVGVPLVALLITWFRRLREIQAGAAGAGAPASPR